MTDKEYAPLTVVCVRALNDKLYEKRKGAALEIERMMKEFVSTSNIGQIQKLLKVLGQDFALSGSPNSRKGGLIGLAACAIGLGKEASHYVTDLVKPVLACFSDSDSRVRYYGCESLYNIVKVARGSVLPFFNDIFDGLSKLTADPDQNVRSGSDLLDRLMKDIVTESASFDLVAFIPMLRERIYTRNGFARQFLVSWVSVLDHVPDIDMLVFLPEILDGLFHILGDSSPEIRKMCEATLGEFLRNICKTERTLNFPTMANILILHSQSTDALIQLTAISWLKELILLSGRTMIPFTSGILTAVHPCLSYDSPKRKNTREAAKAVNSSLMKLVSSKDDEDAATDEASLSSNNHEKPEAEDIGPKETTVPVVSNDLLPLEKQNKRLDVASIVKVLLDHLSHDSMQTRIAALNWIFHLHIKTPNKVFEQMDTLFPKLLQTLSDPSDEVVLRNLEVLSEIASNPVGHNHPPKEEGDTGYELPVHLKKVLENSHNLSAHFSRFMVSLLRLFRKDQTLLDDRGPFIIRQLCLLLKAENIYRCCSEILQTEQDGKFAAHMIKTLSTILLTSTELFELRSQLKDLKTEESCSLFCGLYRSWCHNPVSTVALCLLTQNYQHACDLLAIFGDLEVTVDFLTEIDKLVQLLESPIFTYLRLQLLDVQNREYLIKSLYGLLMLLPQSDAFTILQRRLECVPQVHLMPHTNKQSSSSTPSKRLAKKINFQELLAHFKYIQEAHRAQRHQPRHIDDIEKVTTQV